VVRGARLLDDEGASAARLAHSKGKIENYTDARALSTPSRWPGQHGFMSKFLAPVLSCNDLPEAELQAARLDGEVFRVGDCFCPIDQVELRVHRALALSTQYSRRLIAEQHTAAWVYGLLNATPLRFEFCVSDRARSRAVNPRQASIREVAIDEDEVVIYAGLRVTSPLRTVTDLSRFSAAFGAAEICLVQGLLGIDALTMQDCEAALHRRHNLPGKRRAARRLETVFQAIARQEALLLP
jgi:hypothetical protein